MSRGTYQSIRLPQNRAERVATDYYSLLSQAPSHSSAHFNVGSQPVFSPLPASPYTRVPSAQHSWGPTSALFGPADHIGGNQDARRAFERHPSSPLDIIQERATSYLDRIAASRQAGPSHLESAAAYPAAYSAAPSPFHQQNHQQLTRVRIVTLLGETH